MKKKRGGFEDFIIPMIGIIFLFAVAYHTLDYTSSRSMYDVSHQVARKYLLKIETKGYLDSTEQGKLRTEMNNLGFKNVNISGTTTSPVAMGADIYLKVTFDYDGYEFIFTGPWPERKKVTRHYVVQRSSIAKH